MTDVYRKELIARSVSKHMAHLISMVFCDVSEAERIEVLRAVKDEACLLIHRTKEAIEFHKALIQKGNVTIYTDYGWVYYDKYGKDYGPWPSVEEASTLGPIHAAKEEKILRGK